jgi:hypothetical protein
MVCGRCEMALTSELEKNGALYSFYSIGEVEIATDLDDSQKQISKNLNSIGLNY